jgi:hypothetical protein
LQEDLDGAALKKAKAQQEHAELARTLERVHLFSGVGLRDKKHKARENTRQAEVRHTQSARELAELRKAAAEEEPPPLPPPYERSGSSSQAQQGGPGPGTRARIKEIEAGLRRKRSLDRQDPRGRDSDEDREDRQDPRGRDSDEDREDRQDPRGRDSDEDRQDPRGRGGYGR